MAMPEIPKARAPELAREAKGDDPDFKP